MELAAALFEGVLSLLDSYHLSVAMDDLDKLVTLLVATAAVSTELPDMITMILMCTRKPTSSQLDLPHNTIN